MHENRVDTCFRSAPGRSQDHSPAPWRRHTDSPVHRLPVYERAGNRRCHQRFRPKRSKLPAASSPAIVNRAKNVLISSPDAVWTTDITYIRTKAGWAYLSTIIDQFSRRVIAMRMSYSMASRLCCDTLEDALRERSYPVGVIIHSDKGSQYRSSAFVNLAEKRSVIQSFTSFHAQTGMRTGHGLRGS